MKIINTKGMTLIYDNTLKGVVPWACEQVRPALDEISEAFEQLDIPIRIGYTSTLKDQSLRIHIYAGEPENE